MQCLPDQHINWKGCRIRMHPEDATGLVRKHLKFSLKGEKAGTKGSRSQRVMSEGNIRKEKRTSLVKFLKAPKLSYSMRMVSIESEVFGKSIAKFSMLIF